MQLLSKLNVGDLELKNRVVLAPMTRARCTPTEDPHDIQNTMPNDLMAEYYSQRASGGLLITEGTLISEEGNGWLNAPHIRSDEHAQAWKKVVDKVHEKGGLIFCQLWHMGRQSHSSFHPKTNRIVSASDVKIENGRAKTITGDHVDPEVPHALTVDEVESAVRDFAKAAAFAKKAGFDGVEIHSANGYLIDQFLQSKTNKRTDKYGGSMENRVRILTEVVEAIIADGAYPANRIGFRLSPNGAFGDMGSKDNNVMFPFVAKTMNKYGLAYMHVMDGLGFGYHELCPVVTCADLRKHFDGPIIANIELTKGTGEGLIRSGAADLCAYGRLYISNPDLVERFRNDWPLADTPGHEHWWGPTGAKGYTDWPTYKPAE